MNPTETAPSAQAGKTAQSEQPKPTPCRMVLYNHPAITFNHAAGEEGKVTVRQSPALVTSVNPDGTLRLTVFGPFAHEGVDGIHLVTDAKPAAKPDGTAIGTWVWPPRV